MNARPDLDQQLNSFLREGPTELPNESFDAVRDRTEQTRQRVILGPWRLPEMNKLITVGLGAIAIVAVLIVGARLLPSTGPFVGDEPSPPPTPTVEPSPTDDGSLPSGSPFLIRDPAIFGGGPPITVGIPASGWTPEPDAGAVVKGDGAPYSAGAGLLTGDSGAAGFYVYGDPCHWESSTPDTPATTVDEIVQALSAQASRDATAPIDVTVGGYDGKSITLYVPTEAEASQGCDQDTFATWGLEGVEGPTSYQQGPGQVDEIWILDVDGAIVTLDARYGPEASAALVDEVREIAESASFEAAP